MPKKRKADWRVFRREIGDSVEQLENIEFPLDVSLCLIDGYVSGKLGRDALTKAMRKIEAVAAGVADKRFDLMRIADARVAKRRRTKTPAQPMFEF
jgi:hypothetical protein